MASLPALSAFDLCGADPQRRGEDLHQRGVKLAERLQTRHERSNELARIVESEIVPRLMFVHENMQRPEAPKQPQSVVLDEETTERFAVLSLSSGRDSLLAVIGNLLQQGVSLESIFLNLLAPAARRLGDFWNEDRASFADVTIALGRLQQVVRELGQHASPAEAANGHGRAALFAPAPGEQHTFGIVIIEEFFRHSGWRTWSELDGSREEIVHAARSHVFDVFGMTASSEDRLDQLAPTIMSVRAMSRNRDISVIVGGRLFIERPDLVARVGADAMASDALEAVLKAEGAVRQLARR